MELALTTMEPKRPTDAVRSPAADTRGFATVRDMKIRTPLIGLFANTTCKAMFTCVSYNGTFVVRCKNGYELLVSMFSLGQARGHLLAVVFCS
jgi:hypothetical protein